jgi:hypothetical protein
MSSLPGAEPFDAPTAAALAAARSGESAAALTRVHHRSADGSPSYTNRLALESSPYLLQHAHNPVNWYPWGDEAFAAARRLHRPVFLSIGYSTCHWCHVMEEESFEDEEIARFLNEHFVAIKVDREQRPDLDAIYMAAVQAISGRGGWPMSVWVDADRRPFYAGTYFPARDGDRPGATGLLTVLQKIDSTWRDHAADLAKDAAELAARVRSELEATSSATRADSAFAPSVAAAATFAALRSQAVAAYDPVHGGVRARMKFPSSLPLRALLRLGSDADAMSMVTRTLDAMSAGGIHDQLDGGFHRYSTDDAWLVPHFEKMLYDNALLAVAYLEAFQATARPAYADAARGILEWAATTMTSPDGCFFSALDADSPGPDGRPAEGFYYTWTPEEVAAALGATRSAMFDEAYGVTAGGNIDGRSVLHVAEPLSALATHFSLSEEQVAKALEDDRRDLVSVRSRRAAPIRDEKIVTAWNGLMISAMARASVVLDDRKWNAAASRAADCVLGDFARSGRLTRSIAGGKRQDEAFADDYAFVEAGLLDLFESGDSAGRLDQALALDRVLAKDFEDSAGGLFRTAAGSQGLLAREKPVGDGAEPSAGAVHASNLLRLAEITGDQALRDRATKTLASMATRAEAEPLSFGETLVALHFAASLPKEIVLVSDSDRASLEPFYREIAKAFVPDRVIVPAAKDCAGAASSPLVEDKKTKDGKPTAYVCQARVCELPTTDPTVFAAQLRR